MVMSVWGGENFVTEASIEVNPVAPGVGQIVCPEVWRRPRALSLAVPARN